VGAGPSGLLLALYLSRAGINVCVLEAAVEPDVQPRATHYGPAAVHELRRSGILEKMRERDSFAVGSVSWRASDGTLLTALPKPPPPPSGSNAPPPDGVVSLPLNIVVEILKEAVEAQPTARVEFGCRVVDVGQDAGSGSAWVDVVKQGEGDKTCRIEGSYVVGCDGASSSVRNALFGRSFPGYTWDTWLVAVNVRFHDVEAYNAALTDVNFLIHPTNWAMIARVGGPGKMFRVTYGEPGDMSREDCAAPERIVERLQTILPGYLSDPAQFDVLSSSPYKVHQRCAPSFRVGRVLLAADAAHLCNPMGGMGLTNGIVDVGGLADCLIGMHRGLADESILDKYDSVRRGIFQDVVDGITATNLKRIMQDSSEALAADPFLQACREAAQNPEKAGLLASVMRVSTLPSCPILSPVLHYLVD
jgi:2-polyprenyl-6-methoxyphenol hydroxylase-like FAD-dependent oxidoreductase